MGDATDPLVSLIRQSPVHALIAATFLLGFFSWLVAFEERLRRLMEQRRLTGLQPQLDELRRDIRRLEVQRQGDLVRFLNLERSSSSSTVTPEEKLPSVVPAHEIESVPESPEIAPPENKRPKTKSKIRSTRAMIRNPSDGLLLILFFLLLFGTFVIAIIAWSHE